MYAHNYDRTLLYDSGQKELLFSVTVAMGSESHRGMGAGQGSEHVSLHGQEGLFDSRF